MKKRLKNKMVRPVQIGLLFLMMVMVFHNCHNKKHDDRDVYTCSMHPDVVQHEPGKCPVCGMDLVLKNKVVVNDSAKQTKLMENEQNQAIQLVTPIHRVMPLSIELQGRVTYDTRFIYTVASRYRGRLEKVYAKYALQHIRKGEKLAAIYSPEIAAAEEDLIFLTMHDEKNQALIQASIQKLLLLGLSQTQIDALIRKGEASTTVNIYSPYTGYLITGTENISSYNPGNLPGESMNSMTGKVSLQQTTAPQLPQSSSLIREGNYVNTGEKLFTIVDPSALRIVLDVPMDQSKTIHQGDQLKIQVNDQLQTATVDFIQPFFTDKESFVKVSVYVKNMNHLKAGELVHATIDLDSLAGEWLPRQAVLDLGLEDIVFLKRGNDLVATKVNTGVSSGKFILINGLTKYDSVASDAHYIKDSQSFIKIQE